MREILDFYYIICTKLHLTELKRFLKYKNSKIIDIKCHDLREENNSISKNKKQNQWRKSQRNRLIKLTTWNFVFIHSTSNVRLYKCFTMLVKGSLDILNVHPQHRSTAAAYRCPGWVLYKGTATERVPSTL